MNLFDFYKVGEEVLVKVEKEGNLSFHVAKITGLDDTCVLSYEDGRTDTLSIEQVEESVFKKTPFIEIHLQRYAEGQMSKEDLLGIMISEMLSRQFCDQCRTNQKPPVMVSERVYSYGDTSITINDFEYLGFIWVGDDETGESENIFKYKNRYFVSYLAGNQHEHLAPINHEYFEKIKGELIKTTNIHHSYAQYLASN